MLTEFGQQVFHYADEIFSVGRELREFVKTGQTGTRKRFLVGMPDVVPKLIALELLKPALESASRPRMIYYQGPLNDLLGDLALHKLDVVLSDSPAPTTFHVYNHKLGECGLSMLAAPTLAKKYRKGFPRSLEGAPLLLPTDRTALRRSLDRWMDERRLFPDIVAEFANSVLLNVFGQAGEGIFPVPTAIQENVKKQYGAWLVGRLPEVVNMFYAISVQKRVQHEVAVNILKHARNKLFQTGLGSRSSP